MPDRRAAAVLAVAVLLVLAPATAVGAAVTATAVDSSAAAAGDAAPTEITDCTTITDPGEYVLTADLTNRSPDRPRTGLGACIAVRASDVTLRGGNHTVAAPEGGLPGVVGVLVGGPERPSNVTVRNLTTTGWGAGVAAVGVADATFRNVSAVNNLGDGFFVENAPGATVRGGVVRGSNTGVFVRNAPDARIADATVVDNLAGVSLRQSDGATVEGVAVRANSQYGVAVFRSANVTVADSTVAGSGFARVALAGADGARLRNLTIAPGSAGWAAYAANGSTVAGERVRVGGTALSFDARDVALDPADGAPPVPIERQVVGDPVFALPTGDGARLSLSVAYDDGAVERAGVTEDSLSLWRFDAGEGWLRTGTTVDAGANSASATLADLSENGTVVALVGEGLAEPENETDAGNQSAFSSPASRYSCWTSTTSVESSQSA